jgi:hypothetical protein
MDELLLLEGEAIEAAAAASPKKYLPAPDFTGSLDYIDSLASRRALTLSRRDVATITTAAFDGFSYLSPLNVSKAVPGETDVSFNLSTDFRPLGDARRFNPEFSIRPPAALSRSASRIVANPRSPQNRFPPGWRNPLDPDRDTDELNRVMEEMERRARRKPFARYFKKPNQVVICLKRKLRRAVMHATGFSGMPGNPGFRPPVRTYYSKVIC